MNPILFEKKDQVGFITLNDPNQRNALSLELMDEMQKILNQLKKDKDVKVIVIRGNGPAFCTGHNMKELVGDNYDSPHFKKIFTKCSEMMQTLHKLPQVVIAQVHGIAMAAGCQLVAACDLAIADTKTKFSTPGVKIGLFCSTPMVPLSRLIGKRNALDMLLTGRLVKAEEAKEFGLVNRVVSPEELAIETEILARDIAKYSRHTLEIGKKAFYKQVNMDEKAAYDYAIDVISKNCLDYDAQEGMKAFLEKRKPKWEN
jgi:enoyl-CoA hydratase/carnithine racemase